MIAGLTGEGIEVYAATRISQHRIAAARKHTAYGTLQIRLQGNKLDLKAKIAMPYLTEPPAPQCYEQIGALPINP